MKLISLFTRPRWQSKDPAVRRAAVAHDDDRELLASLARLAREDTDPGVRFAAAKRLADPGLVQGLAHDDADAGVRAQARELWLDLLVGTHPASPSATERLRLLEAQDDAELTERVALAAKEPELRRTALARLRRPALLFDRALADPDPAIRLALVERLDDEATLERLADRARKSDKRVARRARERLEELRLSRSDATTLEQRGRLLCERLEQLLREPQPELAETTIVAQWSAIAAALPATLQARFQAARELLAASREPLVPAAPPLAVDATEATGEAPAQAVADATSPAEQAGDRAGDGADGGSDEPPAGDTVVADVVAPLIAQARFAVSLDEARLARSQQAERQRQLEREFTDAVAACEQALDAGASAQAHAARRRLDELRRALEGTPRSLAARLAAVETRYAELARWQRWADRQRREQLCAEIEALPEQRLHPDAVAARVRDAQLEWNRLDALEKGLARTDSLGRRFHAACRAALAPAQDYFRKRQELRQSHAAAVRAALERTAPADDADGPTLVAARRDIVEALRALDRVDPRERKALAEALKARLAELDARIATHDEAVERAKAALIARAEALAADLPKGAVAAARELQQRWREAGNGRRKRDQAQWETFRAAIDRVFGNLDAERRQRDERDAEARRAAAALCDELEALLALPGTPERGAVARLRGAWDALDVRDEALRQRHGELQQRVRERADAEERNRRLARFHAWRERHRACRAAESGGATSPAWSAPADGDIAAAALLARYEAATAGAPRAPSADADDALRDVLVDLEWLAGMDSPADDRDRRRVRQLARLSERLGGAAPDAPADELARLLQRWSEHGPPTDSALDARLERALDGAIANLP